MQIMPLNIAIAPDTPAAGHDVVYCAETAKTKPDGGRA